MSNYWAQRADLRMKETHDEVERNLKQILRSYDKALLDIDESIQRLLYKGDFETLDVSELLSVQATKQEVDQLYRLLSKATSKAQIKVLKNQISQLAYKARITRLEAVKAHINARIASLTGSTESQMRDGLTVASESMYNKSIFDLQQEIGYAFPFQKSTDQMINTILNSNWSGKHWSDRLWSDNRQLAENLVSTLSNGIPQGKSYYTMARELKENMNTGEYQAVRLIRTEATFVANQAKLIALENSGVDEFEYVAVLDARTSEICQDHDGAIIKAKDAVFGLNLPPLHPNCRSTFIARIPDEMKADLKRMALNPVTGEKEQIPRSMTYKEWRQSLYDQYGRSETDIAVKKIKNSTRDLDQYELYKKTVGIDQMPKSFEDFQQLKYNDIEGYQLLKNRHNDAELRIKFKNGEINLTINPEKQARHVLGPGYIEGRSYLLPDIDPQALVNEFAGTGKFDRSKSGIWLRKEIVELDRDIGVNFANGQKIVTNSIKIHYSETGTHVVPTKIGVKK